MTGSENDFIVHHREHLRPQPDCDWCPLFKLDRSHLEHQHEWSVHTFGPQRVDGVLDHIGKELVEIQEAPDDVEEWADLIILAFDGAMRAGHEPQAVLDAIQRKQIVNESRVWPDWRTAEVGKAIEHVKDPETPTTPEQETQS